MKENRLNLKRMNPNDMTSSKYFRVFTIGVELVKDPENQKFAVVGASCAFSVLLLTWILTELVHIYHLFSVIISIQVTIVWAFFVLDKWTFNKINRKHSMINRFIRYNLISLTGLGLNVSIFTIFAILMNLYYLLALFFTIICTAGFNFYMSKKFAWAKNSN